jgi:hypothetical protein
MISHAARQTVARAMRSQDPIKVVCDVIYFIITSQQGAWLSFLINLVREQELKHQAPPT